MTVPTGLVSERQPPDEGHTLYVAVPPNTKPRLIHLIARLKNYYALERIDAQAFYTLVDTLAGVNHQTSPQTESTSDETGDDNFSREQRQSSILSRMFRRRTKRHTPRKDSR